MYRKLDFFFETTVNFCRNSLYSIISLVFLIVGCCFIFFYLEVELLSLILLLIYIVVLKVLFLFVVMILNLDIFKKEFNPTVYCGSLFLFSDGSLNHLNMFSLLFLFLFVVYFYKIIKRKNLIIIVSKAYIEKKLFLRLVF